MAATVTVNDLLDGHVALDIESLDRIYLNGYVPNMQVGGQVANFMTRHLGKPVPSTAVLKQIGGKFRAAVYRFADQNEIPMLRFGKGDRKVEVAQRYLDELERAGRPGVAMIGVAQEFQNVFDATVTNYDTGGVFCGFYKANRRVTCYYFYVWDAEFGAGFVKVCAYFPYPIKIWINGHEWAKRQAIRAGVGFTALSNGFATADDPAALQAICDRLGADQIEEFFERWTTVLPLPLNGTDRAAGYWWDLSMRQIEVSRTIVFDAPRRARSFFEALVADNIDIGRPDKVEVIFGRKLVNWKKRPVTWTCKTTIDRQAMIDRGVTSLVISTYYRHSRVKQYLKDGRAMRIETVVNDVTDLGVQRRLRNLGELQPKARAINTGMMDAERVGQGAVLESPAFERISQPSIEDRGRRAPALRFGDPRVNALAGALCAFMFAAVGVTHKSLRARVAQLLGVAYTSGQMSYDLRRLRLKGIIERVDGTNTYRITSDGQRFAIFYTKVHDRLLEPLMAADQPPATAELRHALAVIDNHIVDYHDRARLKIAA